MPTALRTLRLSATGGTRTLGSMIASTTGGAGSPSRVFRFNASIAKYNNLSPSDYFFSTLGGNRNTVNDFNSFYQRYSPNPQ
jgi:hypothetical protein